MTELQAFLLFLQAKVMFPTEGIVEVLLRWIHFLAGITWIGLLYFINLVNVGFMKKLDGPTKGKVKPQARVLMAEAPAVVPLSQPKSFCMSLNKAPKDPFVPVTTNTMAVQRPTMTQP